MINQMKIINEIKSANRVAVISHINPDGDAAGSSLALSLALKKLGKEVDVYLHEGVPEVYSFLKDSETVLKKSKLKQYDAAVALDCGDLDRLGDFAAVFDSAKVKINIDHHITNSKFAEFNHVEEHASSTGEIIYRTIKMAGVEMDKDIAECLYIAVATDTGGFRYSNTSSICMQVAADLINYDIDVAEISRKVFDTVSYNKVRLMGMAIESLEMTAGGKIAIMSITSEQKESINAQSEDFDGIVNIGRSIAGVEASAFFLEKRKGEIKVNLRSNSYVDLSEIVLKFSGGGHKRAAGCTINGASMDEAKNIIKKELSDAVEIGR